MTGGVGFIGSTLIKHTLASSDDGAVAEFLVGRSIDDPSGAPAATRAHTAAAAETGPWGRPQILTGGQSSAENRKLVSMVTDLFMVLFLRSGSYA